MVSILKIKENRKNKNEINLKQAERGNNDKGLKKSMKLKAETQWRS